MAHKKTDHLEFGTYLKKLRFDTSLRGSIVAKYLANPRLVILLLLIIIGAGVYNFINLPRNVNPEIRIPIVIVSTVLPGAGPSDVESLVTIPLEESVAGLEKVKTLQSSSRDSVSVITMEFETGVDPDKARSDVQSAVDSVNNLPSDAQTPKVMKLDFENEPIWIFSISSKDSASLFRFSKQLATKLKDLPDIDEVATTGLEEQEIQILIRKEALASYNISPQTLMQLVRSSTTAIPAGLVQTSDSSFSVSLEKGVSSVDDIRKLVITLHDTPVRLSELAVVSLRSKPAQNESYYATSTQQPQRSVTFNVFKTSSAKINTSYEHTRQLVNRELDVYQGKFQLASLVNTGEVINTQFDELQRDFWITVTLVFIMLFIFLGLRQATLAGVSIPLTFLITFTVMGLTNISLNFLSFFALLLSLGLLVDDTIVVISAMTAYYRTGKFSPLETGLLVWRDFFVAILTTTITTVWAFVPLLLSSGIIGEFIKPIPIVVSTTLLGSIVVALLITLPFIVYILKPQFPKRVSILLRAFGMLLFALVIYSLLPKGKLFLFELIACVLVVFVTLQTRKQLARTTQEKIGRFVKIRWNKVSQVVDTGIISFVVLSSKYRHVLSRILATKQNRVRALVMVVLFSVFSYLLFPLGFVHNEFFPKSENNYIFISVELPAGTNVSLTKQEAKRILAELRHVDGIAYAAADIGRSFSGGGGFGAAASNSMLITLVLPPKGERHISSLEIAEKLRRQYQGYSKGEFSVVESTGGPPAGADLQIKLFGDDLKTLDQYANNITEYLKAQNGVTNVKKSIAPGTSKIVFVPDQVKIAAAGVGSDAIGLALRGFVSGVTLDKIKLEESANEEQDILLRSSESVQFTEGLSTVEVQGPNGALPITSLGQFRLSTNPTLITRENQKRTISVTAAVTQGFSVTALNSQLEKHADSLNLPPGYSWKTGGANEENQNSITSILQAMILSFVLILTTMVIEFSSFRKALIVMLVIPLSVSGVFIIFALTKTPLSFPALIGILALFGIVVKNSILVVDKINQNLKAGLEYTDAIVDGAASRLEAIALTSFTAIVGLIPISASDPVWRGLGGAIVSGLTFSGTIMLFFIPVVYYMMFSYERNLKRR